MRKSRFALVALFVVALLVLAGCGSKAADTSGEATKTVTPKEGPEVKFGSYIDSEGSILGAMVVQMLEANGIKVVDKTKFGTPDVVRKAYLQGDLSGAIDYTGSGAFYVGPETDPVWSDPIKGYATVKAKDFAQNKVVWTIPAPANNTESIAVTKEFADKNNIKTMEDFAAYVNKGGTVKLIGAQVWMDSPLGLKGYEEAYGFTLKKDQLIGLSNGVTSEFIKALANGTNGVNPGLPLGDRQRVSGDRVDPRAGVRDADHREAAGAEQVRGHRWQGPQGRRHRVPDRRRLPQVARWARVCAPAGK